MSIKTSAALEMTMRDFLIEAYKLANRAWRTGKPVMLDLEF